MPSCDAATAPSQVPAPSVSGLTQTSLVLAWSAPAANGALISGYQILLQTGGVGPFTTYIANTSSDALTAPIVGLSASVHYALEVAAINAIGIGPVSAAVDVVTASGTSVHCVLPYDTPHATRSICSIANCRCTYNVAGDEDIS